MDTHPRSRPLRLHALACILRNGDAFNCTAQAKTWSVDPKTIWRDIRALRRAGYLIRFDFRANTFRLAEPDYHI